jgi:hypothetical protein
MKRPFGVTIIGALLFLQGLSLALAVAFGVTLRLNLLAGVLSPLVVGTLQQSGLSDPTSIGWNAAIALGAVATSMAMVRLRPWAWLVAMTLQGITLATELAAYLHGHANYVTMVIGATTVFYLNTRTVRQAFERSWRPAMTGTEGDAGGDTDEQGIWGGTQATHASL